MISFNLYGFTRMRLAVVLIGLFAGCGGPELPTDNPVRRVDLGEFDQRISDPAFSGLVVVFASWCPPCRDELPKIARMHRDQRPEGTQIVALSVDEGDSQTVQRLVNELRIPFPVYHVGMPAVAHYRIVGVPSVMVIRQGKIVEKLPGRHSVSMLADKLHGLARPSP
jgi:thiol-disulfide isomerase/thioredoxin